MDSIMQLKNVLQSIKKLFDDARIDFALIGGLAVGGHGYLRFTNDIDLLIHEEDREKAKSLLVAKGYSIFSENAEFLQLHGACPVDLQIARRPISKKMLVNAVTLPGLAVKYLRAEDLIGLKIQAYSTNPKREFKEKADIQALIERLHSQLNWEQIKGYADLFGKWDEIESIRRKVLS